LPIERRLIAYSPPTDRLLIARRADRSPIDRPMILSRAHCRTGRSHRALFSQAHNRTILYETQAGGNQM